MPSIGPAEIAIVAIVALLILGPKKLPAAGRSLGSGLREFKHGISGQQEEEERPEPPAAVASASASAESPKPEA